MPFAKFVVFMPMRFTVLLCMNTVESAAKSISASSKIDNFVFRNFLHSLFFCRILELIEADSNFDNSDFPDLPSPRPTKRSTNHFKNWVSKLYYIIYIYIILKNEICNGKNLDKLFVRVHHHLLNFGCRQSTKEYDWVLRRLSGTFWTTPSLVL